MVQRWLSVLVVVAATVAINIETIPGSGNDGGKPCAIPFTYNSQTWYGCTYSGQTQAWCGTTATAAKWGLCPVGASGSFPTRLPQLTVSDVDPSTLPPYNRADWPHWTTKNCRTTRTLVLIEENFGTLTFTSPTECSVKSGSWYDYYNGVVVSEPSKLDIDHLVPLQNAHISGGWEWPTEKKKEYANYLGYWGHLIAVGSSANRAKGSKPPSQWKPPYQGYWCEYAVRWISIKGAWDLTITTPEQAALIPMLSECPISIIWPNQANVARSSNYTSDGGNSGSVTVSSFLDSADAVSSSFFTVGSALLCVSLALIVVVGLVLFRRPAASRLAAQPVPPATAEVAPLIV